MSQPISKFPRRFHAHPLQDSDGTFLFLFLLLSAMLIPLVMHLRNLPPATLTREEREKYLRVIYRAPETVIPIPVTPEQPVVEGVEDVERIEEGVEPEPISEARPARETVAQQQQRRQREAVAREKRKQERIKQIRSTALFTAAGAVRSGYGLEQGESALGIAGGSLEGIEARSREELEVRPDVSDLADLRAQGLIREEVELPATDYNFELDSLSFAAAEIRLDALPVLRGRASPDSARRMDVLRSAIRLNLESLRGCYLAQRRRDPGLLGQLMARMTVSANGTVERIRLRESRWSNPALGQRVEACLEQRMLGWEFDPASGGDVTIEFPLVFGGEGPTR